MLSKMTSSLFDLSVLSFFFSVGTGAQWNKLSEPVTVDDNLPLGYVMLMFVVDSILYFIIMWYVEAVFPGNYGIPQKPYFFLTVSLVTFCSTISIF